MRFIVPTLFLMVVTGGMSQESRKFETWGAKGQGSVAGNIVPMGEVWKVRGAGISSESDVPLEYMMELLLPMPEHKPSPGLRVPIKREAGASWGTPVLALERDNLILLPGETIEVRVNGLKADKRIALRWAVWVFPESMLFELVK